MVQAFEGGTTTKVDSKGRMSIPAEFRRVLAAGDPGREDSETTRMKVVFGQHLTDCVAVYTVAEHQRIVNDIYAMPRDRAAAQKKLAHLYVTQSATLEADRDGRIILPKNMREKLQIVEGQIFFRGLVNYFEMWNNDIFERTVNVEIDAWLDEMGEDFDPLSLLGSGT